MRRWNLLPIVLVAAVACGGEEPGAEDLAPAEQPAAAAADTAAINPAPPTPPPEQQQPARVAPVRQAGGPLPAADDEPWTPTHTGTVNPGMTQEEVIGVWGPPAAERTLGAWTYLYFRNGCEVSCGTFDVVFLENGAVVNAIVRGPGHTYGGTSTSPPGQEGRPTTPTGTED